MSSNETPSDETRAQNDNAANRSEVSGPYLAPRDETEVSRFPPPDLPPGTIPPGAFVPGVVEVELRDDVRPHIAPAEDARPTIASRNSRGSAVSSCEASCSPDLIRSTTLSSSS